jgi:class 3 adenylate cyclase
MGVLELKYKRAPANEEKYGKGFTLNTLSDSEFRQFNATILGLGNIKKKGKYRQAMAAFFDLEGFTHFSNQVDAHLVIGEFLDRYLSWLFETIAEEFVEGTDENLVRIWGSLPFYAKFLGDGILFLWDTEYAAGPSGIRNIIFNLKTIIDRYVSECLVELRKHVSKPPPRLRCGVARGQIISVGEGQDFVGPCINIAARLQKLSDLSFAVSRRGIDLSPKKSFVLKRVELRGIGEEELIFVDKNDFDRLSSKEKRLFKDV